MPGDSELTHSQQPLDDWLAQFPSAEAFADFAVQYYGPASTPAGSILSNGALTADTSTASIPAATTPVACTPAADDTAAGDTAASTTADTSAASTASASTASASTPAAALEPDSMMATQHEDQEWTPTLDEGTQDQSDPKEQAKGDGKKPRKSAKGRRLMRWSVDEDQLTLLLLEYVANRDGIELPMDKVGALMNPPLTGEAIKQHLAKLRKARVHANLPVPPAIERGQRRRVKNAQAIAQAELEMFQTNNQRSGLLPPPKITNKRVAAPRRTAASSAAPVLAVPDFGAPPVLPSDSADDATAFAGAWIQDHVRAENSAPNTTQRRIQKRKCGDNSVSYGPTDGSTSIPDTPVKKPTRARPEAGFYKIDLDPDQTQSAESGHQMPSGGVIMGNSFSIHDAAIAQGVDQVIAALDTKSKASNAKGKKQKTTKQSSNNHVKSASAAAINTPAQANVVENHNTQHYAAQDNVFSSLLNSLSAGPQNIFGSSTQASFPNNMGSAGAYGLDLQYGQMPNPAQPIQGSYFDSSSTIVDDMLSPVDNAVPHNLAINHADGTANFGTAPTATMFQAGPSTSSTLLDSSASYHAMDLSMPVTFNDSYDAFGSGMDMAQLSTFDQPKERDVFNPFAGDLSAHGAFSFSDWVEM